MYSFVDPRWHFCDGSLPCHSYFDVRSGPASHRNGLPHVKPRNHDASTTSLASFMEESGRPAVSKGSANGLRSALLWNANSGGNGGLVVPQKATQAHPPTRYRNHCDHVVQLKYVNDLDALISVSLDERVCSLDLERGITRQKYHFHSKPVHCFEWLSSTFVKHACAPKAFVRALLWLCVSDTGFCSADVTQIPRLR